MSPNRYLAVALIGLIAPAALVQPLAIAQAPSEIAERAQQFVVQINNNSNGEYPVGSGFIVGRSGDTYQVLTNQHVLTPATITHIAQTQDGQTPPRFVEGENVKAFVVTITHIAQTQDGQTYQLANIEYLAGADLAVATFTSSRSYPTAKLGQAVRLAEDIHIAGYPAPQQLGQAREYLFLKNNSVSGFVNRQNIEDGYSIYFTGEVFPGMSGSPLLNANGEVVGIYGRAIGPKLLGIPIDLAKQLAQQQNIALATPATPTPTPTPTPRPTPRATPRPTPTPTQTLVSRSTGVDYAPLRRLLQAKEWKAADQKTFELMLAAADRESAGWLNKASLEQFSCEDLRIIDRQWAEASNGKFGFAAQKRVWEEVGRPGEWDWEDDSTQRQWRRMYIKLGWKTGSENSGGGYVPYGDLTFSERAVGGHLPYGDFRFWTAQGYRLRSDVLSYGVGVFHSRAANCNL